MGFELVGVGFKSVNEVGHCVGLTRLWSVLVGFAGVTGCGVLWGCVNRLLGGGVVSSRLWL